MGTVKMDQSMKEMALTSDALKIAEYFEAGKMK